MSKAVARKQTPLTVEVPTYTVAEARNGFADVHAAVKAVAESKRSADRVVGHVMWNAALVTYNVVEQNRAEFIGADKAWKDQGDYVASLGFSKAYGTLLRRMGRAAVVHGVKRGSAAWAFLAVHAGKAPVGAAVALEDSEKFHAELSELMAHYKATGKIADATGRAPQIASESDNGGESGGGESTGGESTGQTQARDVSAGDLLKALGEIIAESTPADAELLAGRLLALTDKAMTRANLTAETLAPLENRMHAVIERETTILRGKSKSGK